MIKYCCLFSIIFIFISCGYRPLSSYSRNFIGSTAYIDIKVDEQYAEHSVFLKNELQRIISHRIYSKIAENKDKANSYIVAKFNSINFIPIAEDDLGYNTSYRVKVDLSIVVSKKDDIQKINVNGNSIFYTNQFSIISDENKNNAIKDASKNALENFASLIAIKGLN